MRIIRLEEKKRRKRNRRRKSIENNSERKKKEEKIKIIFTYVVLKMWREGIKKDMMNIGVTRYMIYDRVKWRSRIRKIDLR